MTENQMPQPPKPPPKSASARLADLEAGLSELFTTMGEMIKDLTLFKEALKLLDNKVSSIIQASSTGEIINDEVINKIMEQNGIDALAQKVKGLVERGFLAVDTVVGENAFVVCKETDAEGNVLNPRIQFALKSLKSTDVQAKFRGAAVGSTVNLDDKSQYTVLESYKIQNPTAPVAPTTEATAEAPVAPTEAPATATTAPSEAGTPA